MELFSPQKSRPVSDKLDIALHPQCAIEVKDLGKSYRIYEQPEDRLKQAIVPRIGAMLGRAGRSLAERRYYRDFWALHNVTFDVDRGQAVGIVGRNGAGKSTLLQLIAGTLQPTTGSVSTRGRVAALLELGSGFNPEFTGRENVQLNAALLGLSSTQTQEKFEGIATFADIGEFIDQPLRTYSSGMVMRLAFAVQTAMDPDILIVDEALAVGDVFFQAKCMARLRKLIGDGVTLLFVSHDSATVKQICDRAILLDRGRVIAVGPAGEVSSAYQRLELEARNNSAASSAALHRDQLIDAVPDSLGAEPSNVLLGRERFESRAGFNRVGTRTAEVVNVQMLKQGHVCDHFDYGDVVTLRQVVRFNQPLRDLNVSYKITTPQGTGVVFGDTRLANEMHRQYSAGALYVFDWTFRLVLLHGRYCIQSGLAHPPSAPGEDWRFVDIIPVSYDFAVAPRKEGMIDGLVTWDNRLAISSHQDPERLRRDLPEQSEAR